MNWRLYLSAFGLIWLALFFCCACWMGLACLVTWSAPSAIGVALLLGVPTVVALVCLAAEVFS